MLYVFVLLLSILCFGSVGAEHSAKESAALARQLVADATLGDISTVMSGPIGDAKVADHPFVTPEYVADDGNGNLLVYLVTWGTHAQNQKQNKAASISLASADFTRPPPTSRGSLDEARVSLIGSLERISDDEEIAVARQVFLSRHPDAAFFPHSTAYFRLVPAAIRWIGGFGDRHFNGWVPLDLYRGANAPAPSAAASITNPAPQYLPRTRPLRLQNRNSGSAVARV
ncbi:pyridoxamine 5'-phosphate oxidase-domain-containing protein [Geranomyces variabilis]|nr:pyridoxamine 5'-phosphate oxidase-domain-containing protein [Geranomyces variabilis]KAJ3142301.1 hypothetical protein HDU90_004574 [Geranomyces variabilis]